MTMKFLSWTHLISLFLLEFFGFGVDFATNVHTQQHSDSLLCRKCGHDITVAANLNNIGSKLAIRQRNDTILGVKHCLIQLFKNPHGQHFELVTATSANIKGHGEAFEEHSWFPGYAWRIAVCPQCGAHMGWSFEDDHIVGYEESKSKYLKNHDDLANGKEGEKEESPVKTYSFVGLIYPNLIPEHYADSLIVTPKAYRS
ncbi:protein cereblon-like isoform X3 [Orbicella faveolata]|uniref:protein cereblon-like isoform X3 n=1 Tax=Orbicella faveolata TaxID=48498 RepID=UPI0009E29513|nr:protein cereblon-like isoform X3 [Orbicella faveolata]